ncbi:M20/M25/M40 family metallo-hydrolase [Pedomonas mirosovicensis]|uniref:M20/M25/M40 family metallo-hydrolase n=1 Tax=Pedomonas mirosovicensis TaxID=2908641 RepID=UPI002167CC95|nr:M20/M25/M40 family metallo-hydrolase [Pedomonas mirosovicensis]MCH8686542.1 M20/M25/M40 family metallo-hydrolase [Pedomonas mirosovicensis]
MKQRSMMRSGLFAGIALLAVAAGAQAAPAGHPQAEAQALDLAKKSIAMRSVRGEGNQTAQVAELYKQALINGGFDPKEITITPVDDTVYFIARWPGSDSSLKPLVISGHMDVVEANPADWERDPFTPVVENGYLFGRGATDMKTDGALAISSLIEMKRQGYKPRRDIIIEFSGDEETTMKTSEIIAEKLSNAELVLNIDGGGGTLNEQTGKPEYFSWTGAEKTYADYELTVTNPGGHSSEPRPDNAIQQLAAALVRIGNYHFKPELNDLTRAYFQAAAKYERPEIAEAMRAFAANPQDEKAIATLRADPAFVGRIGTTCVATMINGGHALNALPQRATANVNCRIFPGHSPEAIMAELKQVAADPAVSFKDVTVGSVATGPSPMRQDFIQAIEKALHTAYPGVPVIPSMSAGASDSMWFRHKNVPSYSVSPLFIKNSESFSHGLNERVPIANFQPAIKFYITLFTDLSK